MERDYWKIQEKQLMMRKFFGVLAAFSIVFSSLPGISVADTAPGVLIVKFSTSEEAAEWAARGFVLESVYETIYRLATTDAAGTAAWLAGEPGVEFVERDNVLRASANAADPLFVLDEKELTKQWYLPKIQIHQAWNRAVGSNVTIAVVDTGIDARHEDLSDGRVIKGYSSYCQTAAQNDPTNCLIRVTCGLAAGVTSDDSGHGTIVAGLIGAVANNSRGIAGVNWNVRLMPIKVLASHGSGLASDVAVGIRWAADNGARIINLSIGGQGLDGVAVLQDAITYAFNKGVLIVAAAGNDSAESGVSLNSAPVLPVCADGGANMVVGVAATDIDDRKGKFSNYGSNCVDIAAPGTGTFIDKQQKQGLVSTYYDPTRPGEQDLYVYAVGTSVAAPLVAGVAGLMMSIFPDLDVQAIRERLIASVDNIDQANQTGCNGGSCAGQLGRGRLNAFKAVSESVGFNAGAILRAPDNALYLIERGLRRPMSSFVYSQRFSGSPIQAITADQLAVYPLGQPLAPSDGTLVKSADNPTVYIVESGFLPPPAQPAVYPLGQPLAPSDGTLVKSADNPTVYIVESGLRHALSYLSFISRNLRFESVVTLPTVEIATYPTGADAAVLNGALLMANNHPAVYVLNNGSRQLLSFYVFQQRGFTTKPIAVLDPVELGRFPLHSQNVLYPPSDGSLVRGEQVATVYVFEGGVRRGLTLNAFQNRRYSFANVRVLPQSEVNGYQAGPDLMN